MSVFTKIAKVEPHNPATLERAIHNRRMDVNRIRSDAVLVLDPGIQIAGALADAESPGPRSPLRMLAGGASQVGTGNWSAEDFHFLFEALRGLTAIAGAQSRGLRNLLEHDSELLLHPSLTLIRGVAEASGLAIWILEPWIAPLDQDDAITDVEWLATSSPILLRSQLVLLDALHDRRHRHEEEKRQEFVDRDQAMIDAQVTRITSKQAGIATRLSGRRRDWMIAGERLPTRTGQVQIATEYSYGQRFRNTGMSPYPMLSGYAHASLDVLFAYDATSGKPPMTSLLTAPDVEVGRIVSLGVRLLAAMLDVVSKAINLQEEAFADWDADAERFVAALEDD